MSTVSHMRKPPAVVPHHFSVATLTPEKMASVRSFGVASSPTKYRVLDNGNRLYERDPVFKTGQFKDSMGMQNTWEDTHLSQMVFNFEMLRDAGKLRDIPWRSGHPSIFGGGGEVVGWIRGLTFENGVLYADWECTEPSAAEKYDRGTFGPRSAEVGFYESNDEALYWPVFMGCAFVDIPAVEGLFTKEMSMEHLQQFSVLPKDEVDRRVMVFNGQQSAQGGSGGTGGGESPSERPAEQQQPGGGTGSGQTPDPQPNTGGDNAGTGSQSGTQQHAASVGPHTFTIAGRQTADVGEVQRYISSLEQAQQETTMANRAAFVNSLASRNLVLAPNVPDTVAFAQGLTPEQFEAWQRTFPSEQAAPAMGGQGGQMLSGQQQHGMVPQQPTLPGLQAPPNGVQQPQPGQFGINPQPPFGQYGQQVGQGQPQNQQVPPEIQDNIDIIKHHKQSGMKPDQIKALPSAKALEAAGVPLPF